MALRSVYLETTVVSYLVARPSKLVLLAAHQRTTREWWANRRSDFDLYISQIVIDEAGAGEKAMAEHRLVLIAGLPMLEIEEEVRYLARALIGQGPIPMKAAQDAVHLATAAVHGSISC